MSIGTIGNRAVRGCLTGLFALALTCGLATSSQAQLEETTPAPAPTAQTEVTPATPAPTETPVATPAPAYETLPREAHEQAAEAAEHAEEHHGLTNNAPLILDTPYFKINNSMVVTWFIAILLIIAARVATRNIKEVPEGAQNFWEWMVESLYDFLEGIIGSDLVKQTFWFFATLFIFILFTNWGGLLPGVGTVGWGTPDASGSFHHFTRPLLRGTNADFNMTFGMALVFFILWTYWAIKANGPGGFLLHLFGPKGEFSGLLKLLMVLVFMIVGVLEVVSILFRPVSLSFRLFGNVFAGENMLETMALLGGKYFGWLLPVPFYFMELLVGAVQALVFMLLTAVFTLLICTHDEAHH